MRAEDLDIMEELGHGNYGSVRRALHKPTQTFMAIKETRLALDKDADQRIVRELEILHNARSAHIIDFHGAFTAEGSIYSLIEYMDAGSLDKLTGFEVNIAYRTVTGDEAVWQGMPEIILKRICSSTVKGLHFLKNDLDVMHRDVKPTNVLMNLRGQVKVCDFGVSKQLENSKVARTNIGCQTYMAPERIQGESRQSLGDYTVAADVWSVGLTAIEVACGHYPWPMNFMSEAFAQLSCIMHGDLPTLPPGYSEAANHWVDGCLNRNPDKRPTYQQLIDHPWLADDNVSDADMISWTAIAYRFKGSRRITPAPPVGA
ncbi:kinase-like protein [Cylindrobasidium torrendii FP15055 ss-10]|uniref:mitogen-activated protein kinase kinase n=1 Tax=Cylindrobasidium torrendii FP15055 ss-10 TaxID=1314674 RepID=A0A0D7AXY5_9AGAR|nr:kinase-like protein [Cylindrobasidium torrendii FP15055 ss-10]